MQSVRFAILGLCLALLGLAPLAGCASRTAPPPPEPDLMDLEPYVIGAGDVLRISVWKNPELGAIVPVRPDGKISLPLLDDVQASGLTPEELKVVITESLREFVANPDVTVVVTGIQSKFVYLTGGVVRTGSFNLNRQHRLVDVLIMNGGFSPFADKSDIRVLRHTENGIVEYSFDYDAYMDGETTEGNILLQPGDTVVVGE